MNYKEVIDLLKANQNEAGIEKWNQRKASDKTLKSFGIGLTVLRKLGKKVGRDHDLALELWKSDIYDAKVMALLIDDPKLITEAQAEAQVDHVKHKHLAHVFSSCDAALAKTSFAADLAIKWINSEETLRKSCGYGLLYELSKSKKKSAPNEDFFLAVIEKIRNTFEEENMIVRGSMGAALLGIGKRSLKLNQESLAFAKKVNPIELPSEGKYCEPLDLVKHLTSDYIKNKLGVTRLPLETLINNKIT